MRGDDRRTGELFSYVDLESRVRTDHPLRKIREVVNGTLLAMSADFSGLYSHLGRPGIPPERLLRALLLQCFYSARSERHLMERLEFDLLFRWFVGLGVDEPVWDASSFSKNRDRLLAGEVARRFLAEPLARPEVKRLLSSEHFSVDGTLIQAWASQKSFRRKDGGDAPPGPGRNGTRDFKGEKRSNETHASTTDPDARLYRKGDGERARLCYLGHALMEFEAHPATGPMGAPKGSGLIVGGVATRATSDAEPAAAVELVKAVSGRRRITLGADKAYDTRGFVLECREENVTPHVAQAITTRRGSCIDGRATRHPGYAVSLRVRKRIEEGFGWTKEVAGLAQVKLRGPRPRRLRLRARPRRLRPRASAQAPVRSLAVSAPMDCRLIGRWRIVAADLREGGYLDLCGPSALTIRADGHGEIVFGTLQASLDLAYGHQDVAFDWEGDDDLHEVRGSGSAELLEDGSLEIEFEYHHGDEAVLKAVRDDFFSSLLTVASEPSTTGATKRSNAIGRSATCR